MTLAEITRALRQLRLGGIAATLETRLHQAQSERLVPLDFLSTLIQDELTRRADRLLERRRKQAHFREAHKTLDTFDFDFNKKMDRHLIFELATGRFIAERQDALLLGRPGTGKSHLAQALGHAAIQQNYKVAYREVFGLLEELADATLDGTRKDYLAELTTVPLLIVDDLGMRKLPITAAEDLVEAISAATSGPNNPASWRGQNIPLEISSGARRVLSQFIIPIMHEHRPEDAHQVASQGSNRLVVCLSLRALLLVVRP